MLPTSELDDSFGLEDDLPSVAEYKIRNKTIVKRNPEETANNKSNNNNTNNNNNRNIDIDDNDDESARHDQLPTVDEYKANGTYSAKGTGSKLKLMLCVAAPIALAAILIAVATVLTTSKKGQSSPSSPSSVPFDDPIRTRIDQFANFIADRQWTSHDIVTDPQTPQWKAAVWLADFDRVGQQPEDTHQFRQRYALATFFFATSGREWAYDIGFLEADSVCSWNTIFQVDDENDRQTTELVGVDCSCRPGDSDSDIGCNPDTVKRIYLPKLGLRGEIPTEIQYLTDLEELDVFENQITGQLPVSMSGLQKLRSLVFYDNGIIGPVPIWLAELPGLTTVNFARNALSGGFPDNLRNATTLTNLNLEDNSLKFDLADVGPQPALQALFLGDNDISGFLTDDLVESWPELEVLDLSDNKLAGALPAALVNSPTLVILDLHGNKITGLIPTVQNNTALEFLALHENEFSGQIPATISYLTNLRHLDLSKNQLTGEIPLALGALTKLEYLFLARNLFSFGPVPEFVYRLKNLTELSLQATNRVGPLSDEIGRLSNLVLLDLANNEMAGAIPEQLTSCRKLRFLILKKNFFDGGLPLTFNRLDKLVTVLVDETDLSAGADNICSVPTLKEYIADCGLNAEGTKEVECTCCTKCCVDGDAQCNPVDFYGNLDPVWDEGYVRSHFRLHEEGTLVPALTDDGVVEDVDEGDGLGLDNGLAGNDGNVNDVGGGFGESGNGVMVEDNNTENGADADNGAVDLGGTSFIPNIPDVSTTTTTTTTTTNPVPITLPVGNGRGRRLR